MLRKPHSGMINKAKKEWDINFKKSFLIEDKVENLVIAKKYKMQGLKVNKDDDLLKMVKKVCNK